MNYSRALPNWLNGKTQSEIEVPGGLPQFEAIAAKKIRERIQVWIEASEGNDPEMTTRCRHCGKIANFHAKRIGFVQTRFGIIRYKRAYYVCPNCYQSTCPLDERLNPYESLARLRTKVAAGKNLPVAELAKSWRLGL